MDIDNLYNDYSAFQAFIVILQDYTQIIETFSYFWKTGYETNVVIAVQNQTCVEVYSYRQFSNNHCGKVVPEKLYQLCECDDLHISIFPRVVKNMHKCPIRVLSNYERSYKNVSAFPLFEETIANEFAELLNLSMNMTYKPESYNMSLICDKYDIVYGLYTLSTERAEVMSFAFPTYFTTWMIFLKKEKRFKSLLQILFSPFHEIVWTLIFFTGFVTSIVRSAYSGTSKVDELFDTYSVLLAVPVKSKSTKTFIRLQFASWLFLGVIFSACYHGVFFRIMKTGFLDKPPKTLQEVIETNFTNTLIFNDEVNNELMNYLDSISFELVEKPHLEVISEVMNSKDRIAGVGTKMDLLSTTEDLRSLHILPERIMMNIISFYFRKNSFMLRSFNKMVLDLYSGGILRKWKKEYHLRKVIQRVNNEFTALGLKEFLGTFQIWFALLIGASLCFVGEMLGL